MPSACPSVQGSQLRTLLKCQLKILLKCRIKNHARTPAQNPADLSAQNSAKWPAQNSTEMPAQDSPQMSTQNFGRLHLRMMQTFQLTDVLRFQLRNLTLLMVGMLLSTSRKSRTMGLTTLQKSLTAFKNPLSRMVALTAAAFPRLPCFLAHRSHSSDTTVGRAALRHLKRRALSI